MNRIFFICTVIAVRLIFNAARATVATAGEWLQHCDDGIRANREQCERFAAGVLWGYRVAQDLGGAKRTICIANMPDDKIVALVRKWLVETPAALDISAPQVLVRAFQETCPCLAHATGNPECAGLGP